MSKFDNTSHSSQFTIGKLDAGVAVLISAASHLIEFPSVLLPTGCKPGSIVSISCARDLDAEQKTAQHFWALQESILETFGKKSPKAPELILRNVTQTAVTLEWQPLELATSKLLSLTIWRNGQRLAAISNPTTNTSTKLSGLDVDANYSFHLVLKTSAGTFMSNIIKTRTHTIQNTAGIRVCFGTVHPPELLDAAKDAVQDMQAEWSPSMQIETTHFVCTSPGSSPEAPNAAQMYQRALQQSIPTVLPSWLQACQQNKKIVAIAQHYLGNNTVAASSANQSSAAVNRLPPSRSSLAKESQPVKQVELAPAVTATPARESTDDKEVNAGLGITTLNQPPETPSLDAKPVSPDDAETQLKEGQDAPETPLDAGELQEVAL